MIFSENRYTLFRIMLASAWILLLEALHGSNPGGRPAV